MASGLLKPFTVRKKGDVWYMILPHGKDVPVKSGVDIRENHHSLPKGVLLFTMIGNWNYYVSLNDVVRDETTKEITEVTIMSSLNTSHIGDVAHALICAIMESRKPVIRSSKGRVCYVCLNAMETKKEPLCCYECKGTFAADSGDKLTCKECTSFGFSTEAIMAIHRPLDRKVKVFGQNVTGFVHYPQCITEKFYRCIECQRWIDNPKRKTNLIYNSSFRECKLRVGYCKRCEEASAKPKRCVACFGDLRKMKSQETKGGPMCTACVKTMTGSYPHKNVDFKPIRDDEKNRTFGVELEVNGIAEIAKLAEDVGNLDVDGVKFAVKSDGSVYYGLEIVSMPADSKHILPAIEKLFKTVRQHEHHYERSGLHIHVGDAMNKEILPFLVLAWCAFEPNILSLLPQFRRNNEFCMPLVPMIAHNSTPWDSVGMQKIIDYINEQFSGGMRSSRYRTLNICCLSRYGTVEIRCMDSHTDFARLKTFMSLLNAIWDFAKEKHAAKDDKFFSSVYQMTFREKLNLLNLHPSTKKYLINLADYFNSDSKISPLTFNTPDRPRHTFKSAVEKASNRMGFSESELLLAEKNPQEYPVDNGDLERVRLLADMHETMRIRPSAEAFWRVATPETPVMVDDNGQEVSARPRRRTIPDMVRDLWPN